MSKLFRSHGYKTTSATLRRVERGLLLMFGKEVHPGVVAMSRRVARREISKRRDEIAALERLGRSGQRFTRPASRKDEVEYP